MDNKSYFFCILTYAIIYVLIHQIIFRFYLLEYSLFFSSTLVLTSSIDVVFILSMWPSGLTSTMTLTLTLNFQGQIWDLLYLSPKLSNCHETKSELLDWTLGFKCSHQFGSWPWPRRWVFMFKFQNAVSQEWQGGFILSVIHDHDHDLLVTNVRYKGPLDNDQGDFRCRTRLVFGDRYS